MYFQDHEFRQLHAVFEYLFISPYALNGSWASSTYRYAPRYIRRGPLLLQGRREFEEVYVIVPPEAAVTPVRGESRPGALNFPIIESGEAIRVTQVDGPWWDLLRSELAAMSAELKTHRRVRQTLRESRGLSEEEKRVERYQQAADVVLEFLPKPPEN